jgi:hypothetical protein
LAGSWVAELEALLLGLDELLLGLDEELSLDEPELLGWALELELEGWLALESLLEVEPPEALPDGELALLEEAPGAVVAPPVPPTEAEFDEEPGAVDGDDGVAVSLRAVLELEEPGAVEVRSGPLSQAARPKASATATARVESFMFPPWVGIRKKAAISAPGLTP